VEEKLSPQSFYKVPNQFDWMNKKMIGSTNFFCLLCLLFFVQIHTQELRDDVPIWPYPKSYLDTKDGKTISLNKNQISFKFINTRDLPEDVRNREEITEGVKRYLPRMFPVPKKNNFQQETFSTLSDAVNVIQVLIINYEDVSLNLESQEHYELIIPSPSNPSMIEIKAETVW
jgi:hypothetical protein